MEGKEPIRSWWGARPSTRRASTGRKWSWLYLALNCSTVNRAKGGGAAGRRVNRRQPSRRRGWEPVFSTWPQVRRKGRWGYRARCCRARRLPVPSSSSRVRVRVPSGDVSCREPTSRAQDTVWPERAIWHSCSNWKPMPPGPWAARERTPFSRVREAVRPSRAICPCQALRGSVCCMFGPPFAGRFSGPIVMPALSGCQLDFCEGRDWGLFLFFELTRPPGLP